MSVVATITLAKASTKVRWRGKGAMVMTVALAFAYLAVMVSVLGLTFVLIGQDKVTERAAAMTPVGGTDQGPGWWNETRYLVDGSEFTLVGLSGEIDHLPPGLERVPEVGEAMLSPGAEELLAVNDLPDDYFGRPSGTVSAEALETPDLPLVYRGVEGHSEDAIPFSGFGEAQDSSLLFGARPELEPKWEIATLYMTAIGLPAVFFMTAVGLRARTQSAGLNRRMELLGISPAGRFAVHIPAAIIGVFLAGTAWWSIYSLFAVCGVRLGAYHVGAQDFRQLTPYVGSAWLLLSVLLIGFEATITSRYRPLVAREPRPHTTRVGGTMVYFWLFIVATVAAYWLPAMLPIRYQFIGYIVLQVLSLVLAAMVFPRIIAALGSGVRRLGVDSFSSALTLAGSGMQRSAPRIGVLGASLLILCTYAAISVIWSNTSTALSHKALEWRDPAVEKVVVGRLVPSVLRQYSPSESSEGGVTLVTARPDGGSDTVSIFGERGDWSRLGMSCAGACEFDTTDPQVDPRIRAWMNWSFGAPGTIRLISGSTAPTDGEVAMISDDELSDVVVSVNAKLFHSGVREGFFEHPDETAQTGIKLSGQKADWIELMTTSGVMLIFCGLCWSWWVEAGASARRIARPAAIFGRTTLPFAVAAIYAGLPILVTGAFAVAYAAVVPSSLSAVMETPMPGVRFYGAIAVATVAAIVVLCLVSWFYGRRCALAWSPSGDDEP